MTAETADLVKSLAQILGPSVFAIFLLLAGRSADRKEKAEEYERQLVKEKMLTKQKVLFDFLSYLAETHNAFRVDMATVNTKEEMNRVKSSLIETNKKAFLALHYIENEKFIDILEDYSSYITDFIVDMRSHHGFCPPDHYKELQEMVLDSLKV